VKAVAAFTGLGANSTTYATSVERGIGLNTTVKERLLHSRVTLSPWLLSQPRVPSRIGPEALVAAATAGSFQMTDWLIENSCEVVVCGLDVGYTQLFQCEALSAAISHQLVQHMACFHRAPLVHRHGRQAAAVGCCIACLTGSGCMCV
jgi:hypothetical protein